MSDRTENEQLSPGLVVRTIRHNVETAKALDSPFACVAQDVATFAAASIERMQELLRISRLYVLGSYPESQEEAEAREELIQEIDRVAPPIPMPKYEPCGKEFARGQICVSQKGHEGECDDLPF
jgi:hypothetical protein